LTGLCDDSYDVPMGKISLKDIAGKSGVSISTVSRVINDPEQVQLQTRDAVYQAMRDLGYKPSLKTDLTKKGSGAIAMISSYKDSEFFMDFTMALQDELSRHKLYPLLIDTRGNNSLSDFIAGNNDWVNLVDGAIVFYCEIDLAARDFFHTRNLPVVTVHNRCPYFFSVMNNDYLGGYDTADYLWGKGYRKFGMVYWNTLKDEKSRDRKIGFCKFLEEKNMPLNEEEQLVLGDMTMEGGARATEQLLFRYKADVIFYACDTMAIGGMEYCREKHIRIPEDLGIMGFDDIRMAEAMNLTTMKQFIPAKARSVSNHITDAIKGVVPSEFPEEVTFTPVVVERKTT